MLLLLSVLPFFACCLDIRAAPVCCFENGSNAGVVVFSGRNSKLLRLATRRYVFKSESFPRNNADISCSEAMAPGLYLQRGEG